MASILGKTRLCSCERFETHFKSVQEFHGRKLFDRYGALKNIINRNIPIEFAHFLAEPVFQGDIIIWYSINYDENPRQLSNLTEDDFKKYEEVLNNTIKEYRNAITRLNSSGMNNEAECLEKAIKFINHDFVYCFDGKVVLGIWGMELREHVREPLGIAMKNIFTPKARTTNDEEVNTVIDEKADSTVNNFLISFLLGPHSNSGEKFELRKNEGELISENEIPDVIAKEGYEFVGWNQDPNNYEVNSDTEFSAIFNKKNISPKVPWYKRLWLWLTGSGCLKWLLYLLLLLLLILLICWLFRTCNHVESRAIPSPIQKKPWVRSDPRAGKGGIYNPGNPYDPVPTPPEYRDILPPNQGEMPPFDTSNLVREPGRPVIFNNRLNILLENEDKSIMELAKKFKELYPSDDYTVVYYDNVVKRMQVEVPSNERVRLKQDLPSKVAPGYKIFVFDEALFEGNFSPNDPGFTDSDKSWYLKAVNAPAAWDLTTGSTSITIAVVDNGFNVKHPEIKDKIVMPYNVWKHSNRVMAQRIDHGTHVAGTAVAAINNGIGISGIAGNCALMPIQVSNEQDVMTTTSLLDGVLYALYQGADVVNMSVGMKFSGNISEGVQRELQRNHFKEEERLWNEIMRIADKHNAIIVAAAGNDNMLAGVDPIKRPKNFIVVSAVDQTSSEVRKANFSNYGTNSTISAPGVKIYSASGSDGYSYMEGTSMAAPIVTGAVALMKSLQNNLTAEQIICILQSTGVSANGKIGKLIQIDKALNKVKDGGSANCSEENPIPSTGDVQLLLSWSNQNDLDLACVDPQGNMVWFRNKRVPSGGFLEIDMNVQPGGSNSPIENIYWPVGGAPKGKYTVYLWHYRQHIRGEDNTPYSIKVKFGDQVEEYSGSIAQRDGRVKICSFTLDGNVAGSDEHNSDNSNSSGTQRDRLERERQRLQREIDQIDDELNKIRNN